MASRYWVGGSGTWDATDTTHWSTTSGGSGGASVPTSTDNAIFNGSSGGGTVTINGSLGTPECADLTFTGFTGTLAASGVTTVYIYGSLTLASGMTISGGTFAPYVRGSTTHTVTTAGKTLNRITFAGGTYTLQDAISLNGIGLTVVSGTLDANNYNVTTTDATIYTGSTVTLGTGTWRVSGSWSCDSGATLTASGSSIIDFGPSSGGAAVTFAGGGKTYDTLRIASGDSTQTVTISGANTFGTLESLRTSSYTLKLPSSVTTTVSSWGVSGLSGGIVTLAPSVAATTYTISKSSGTVNASNLSISYSAATGGATWNASSSTDGGNNSGWTFIATSKSLFFGSNF